MERAWKIANPERDDEWIRREIASVLQINYFSLIKKIKKVCKEK